MRARDFRKQAWDMLAQGNYWMLFLASLIVSLIIGGTAYIFVGFILAGPLTVGLNLVYLRTYRGDEPRIEIVFEPFSKSFVNSLVAFLLKSVFTFLWSLLLVIPGIIKSYAYAMTEHILADNPEMDGIDAITESRKMMDGHKWRLFCLHFSFIGWMILGILTFGIGMFFLTPYLQAATTAFYLELKGEDLNKEQLVEEVEIVDAE